MIDIISDFASMILFFLGFLATNDFSAIFFALFVVAFGFCLFYNLTGVNRQ